MTDRRDTADAQALRRETSLQVDAVADDLEQLAQRLRDRVAQLREARETPTASGPAGAEAGDDPAERMARVYEELVEQLRAMPDPVERVNTARRVLEAATLGHGLLARVSEEAVWRLHNEEGLSYVEIGRRLGVGRSRATEMGARWVRGKVRTPRS